MPRLAHTLAIWQYALGDVTQADDFTLDVRYILTGMLEGESFEFALLSFCAWMHPIHTPESDGAASIALWSKRRARSVVTRRQRTAPAV